MDKVYDICCGVDVYKKLIDACLRPATRMRFVVLAIERLQNSD